MSRPSTPLDTEPPATLTRSSIGQGALWITSAKLFFIISSYGIQLILPRLLGSAEAFGAFSTVMSVVSIVTNVLIVATVQSVSKRVSEDTAQIPSVIHQALRIQLLVGLPLSGFFLMAGPWFASSVLLDPQLGRSFQITAAVIFAYSLYAVFVGVLNGQQRFVDQAKLDMTFSVLRTLGLLGGALMGAIIFSAPKGQPQGILGAFLGFALAALCILTLAVRKVGLGRPTVARENQKWLSLVVPLWLYQLFINMMMQADLAVLKRTTAEMALHRGLSPEASAIYASGLSGLYRAAQTFAFVPYQIVLSISFVIFPLISSATSAGDHGKTRSAIRQAFRMGWLLLLAIGAPIAGTSRGVLKLAYPAAFTAGSSALQTLIFAQCALALFVIAATVLSGSGRVGSAAGFAGGCVCILLLATQTLIPLGDDSKTILRYAATGTAIATSLASTAAGIWIYRLFGAWIPWRSLVRGSFAGLIAFSISHLLDRGPKVWTLIGLCLGSLAYVTVLWLTKEVTPRDLKRFSSQAG